jgi:glycosyltransferase involved in cell wall biosynthesis
VDPSLIADVPAGVRVRRTGSFEPLRLLEAVGGKKAVPHAGFAGARKDGPLQRAMRWVRGNWMLPDARRGWVRHAVRAASEAIRDEGIDTIVISSPPHSSQLIGLRLKKRFPSLRWIADLRDPWTDIYFAKELMKGAAAQRRDAAWEAAVIEQADAVVVVGPSLKRGLADRYGGVIDQKIHVITNGYDAADLVAVKDIRPTAVRFRITYVGTMAGSYDPRAFFRAVKALGANTERPVELRFVGAISGEVRAMAEQEGITDRCAWVDPVPHEEALREMASANMLLLVIPAGPGDDRILTGKLFEYIGVRRPILGLGPVNGDAAAIIRESAAGEMFARDQEDRIAAWIAMQAKDPTTPPGNGSHTRYERRTQAGELARIINSKVAG